MPRRFWFPVACLLLASGFLPRSAQAQMYTLTTFELGASPNPVGYGFQTTLTATLAGDAGTPTGTVDFYYSSNTATCSADNNDIGIAIVNTSGVASLTPYPIYNAGMQPICATYTPDSQSAYQGETAGVYLLTVDQPAELVVTTPGEVESGTPINFSFTISVPAGQPTPTGSVMLYDDYTGYQVGPTLTITNGTIPPINGVTLTNGSYYASYSGDTNYIAQTVYGTVFEAPGLTLANPDIIYAASGNTTVTLTGLNFANGSIAYLTNPNPAAGPVALTTTYISGTQIQAVIPAAFLANPGTIFVYVATGDYTTNSLQVQVDSPYGDTITATSNPSTFTYGTTSAAIFGSTVTPSAADGGVPAGQISFSLAPTGGGSTAVGSAQLSQNTATTGAYVTNTLSALDTGSSKLLSADFNGDGYFDIVSMPSAYDDSPASGPYLQVMLSTGADTFASEEEVYVGCTPQDFAVGDINNDGKPDIVVICQNTDDTGTFPVAEYILGNGDGTFQAPVAFATNAIVGLLSAPTQIAVGDFNGDGFLDVALVDGYYGNIQVLFNDAASPFDGVYRPSTVNPFDTTQGEVLGAAAADFNHDGKSDVALLEYSYDNGSGGVIILTSNGTGGFNATEQDFTANTPVQLSMAVTDVNGDGYPDVAVADPGVPDGTDTGQVIVFENTGLGPGNNGTLNTGYSIPAQGAGSVTGAPFPVVGSPASNAPIAPNWNLLYSSANATTHVLAITPLQRLGVNNWQAGTAVTMGLDEQYNYDSGLGFPVPMVSSDANGDGYLDATLFGVDANNNTWLQSIEYGNSATASLTNSPTYPTAGTYNLTASYPGNYLFAGGTGAGATNIVITRAASTESITGPSMSTYGNPVTLVATVVGVPGAAIPTGTVQFSNNGNPLGAPVAINPQTGQATLTTPYLPAGNDVVTGTYSGDTNYVASSPAYLQVQVTGLSFSLGLSSSTTQTTSGSVVTFTVTATGASFPTLEQVTLTGLPTAASVTPTLNANGVAAWSFGQFPPGNYTIQANYPGDNVYAAQQSGVINLNVTDTPVSVTVQPNANPLTYPAPATLTSIVSANGLGIPTGSVDVELGPSGNQTDLGGGNLSLVNGSSGLNQLATIDGGEVTDIAIVSGDFNGDGKPDLAWLQQAGQTVQLEVALGNGDGTFQTPVTYTADPTTVAMVAGQFNHTAYSGLAVAAADGNVSVYLPAGDAAGDLNLSQTIAVPGALGIASADFNGDGIPDLAVISPTTISVFYGTSSGAFPATPSWKTSDGDANYVGITAANFVGPANAGIAVSDSNDAVVWVYLYNTQTQTFSFSTYPVGASAGAIAAGDINGDGFPDLAVVSPSDSTVEILINNQSGGFPTGTSYGVAGQPSAVAMADFNQDGYADVAVSGTMFGEGGGTSILLGSASGAITGEMSLANVVGESVVSADFNQDGNPDLAVGNNGITPFLDSSTQYILPSTILPAGTDAITSTFTALGDTVWASGAQGSFDEIVHQGVPTINWSSPAPITYGTALSGAQLDATSPIGGAFTYVPPAGTVLTAGTHALTANFAPTNSADYQANSAQVNLTVNPAGTSINWPTPAPITYGTALSAAQLDATGSVPGTLNYDPPAGTVLTAGTHTLAVTFTPTDTTDYLPSSTSVSIVVNKATPTITWQNPAAISYGTPLSATQLDAVATPAGGVFAYDPSAGAILPLGTQTLSVTYTPVDTTDYAAATKSVTIVVNPGLALNTIDPSSGTLGSGATTITLTGTGFSSSSTVQLNGKTISSAYFSSTKMTAVLPASFFQQVGTGLITVTNGELTTPGLTFTVTAITVDVQLSGPPTAQPGEQPTLKFTLSQGYPLPLQGTFTLSVQPAKSGGSVDPSVQFAAGGDTYEFTIPANSTTTPTVQLQTGTLPAIITITLTLTADGQDVTPDSLAPVVINVPVAPPTITSVTLTRDGNALSVTVQGFSSTQQMNEATFVFTPAAGSTISDPTVKVTTVVSAFSDWYQQSNSTQYGSEFTYVQNFTLSNNASTIAGVRVTLTNSSGTSNSVSAH
ncbi:MAG TPA: FG-GAP-like repeat-containing protein [Acidobacteriaceae bacterium]|nr:FG-GAP-like repeat-containing protein [Acidobacteriaceae bacterium]